MTTPQTRTLELDHLWYGWSQSTLAGRRGYGVVAASDGWDELLRRSEDALGPAVAFPDGLTGDHAPSSGGFVVLDGVPTAFRRLPVANDGLDRPGSYAVHLVRGRDEPLDALDTSRLLAAGVLDGMPPESQQELAPLPWSRVPAVGEPVPTAESDAVLAATVIEGLLESRPVAAVVDTEADALAALQSVLTRLPRRLRRDLSFSTLETRVSGLPFDVVFRTPRYTGSHATQGGRRTIAVDLTKPGDTSSLTPEALQWGRQLVSMDEPPWRPEAEPVDVAGLCAMLHVVRASEANPGRLSVHDIVALADTSHASAWAARPHARSSALRALHEADDAAVERLLGLCRREPPVAEVMTDAAWQCLETGPAQEVGPRNAEAILLGLGVSQQHIDLHLVRRLPTTKESYGAEESARILRTLTMGNVALAPADWACLARLDWTQDLRARYRPQWLEAVMRAPAYRGSRLGNGEADRVSDTALHSALGRAVADGVAPEKAGGRIMAVLPRRADDRTALLLRLSRAPGYGTDAVFLGALASAEATADDRRALLEAGWSDVVAFARLPSYLATALVARPAPARLRLSRRGWLVLVAALVVLVVVAAVVLLPL